MRAIRHHAAAIAMLLAAACGQPAIKASESLVGAQKLPSVDDLSHESIQINRGGGRISDGFLSYELKPDNTLTVTHEAPDRDKIVGQETLELSPKIAAQTRRALWRLRPEKLEGQGLTRDEVRPVGCESRGPHDFGEFAVAFYDSRKTAKKGAVAIFELPYRDSCNTPQALEATKLVRRVLQSYPPSPVAVRFPKSS